MKLSQAHMVIECAFGRLKARFDVLKHAMDINVAELPFVVNAYFVLHNFCDIENKSIGEELIAAAVNYENFTHLL